MSDMEKRAGDADIARSDDEVEAHRLAPEAEDKVGATEEGPDVEGHIFNPKAPPKAY